MKVILAVCIAVLAAIPATALAQGTVETMQLRGKAAFAEWRYVEGDIQTDIAAVVSEDRFRTGGTGGSSTTWSPFATISIFRTNLITGDVLISGVGQSENFEFSVAGDLRSAVVRVETIFQDDSTFTFFDLFVDLRWDATGPRQTDVDRVLERDAGFVYREVSMGAHRPAVATGSILGQFTDAEGNVIGEEEFVRGPSFFGEIQSNKNASLRVVHVEAPFIPQDLVRTLDGTATVEAFFGEQALSVTVDRGDNVIAAGHTHNIGAGADFTVAKWDASGNLLWLRTLDGTAGTNDFAHAVTVDSQNHVIAAGVTRNANTGADFTVAKWDASGNLLWLRTLDGAAEDFFNEQALAVAVDTQDNVVAAGLTDNTGDGQDADFTAAKWDASGNLLWLRTLEGSGRANAVVVDSGGSVIAAGHSLDPNNDDFLVAKWDANGGLEWVRTLNGTADQADDAFSVAVDSQDSVVVAGVTRNANTGEDFTVAKWDAGGNLLWLRTIDGDGVSSQGSDQALAVTVDSQDNVIAAGLIYGGIGLFSVVKWDANGNQQWLRIKTNHDLRSEPALAVAVDSQDNVVAAGHTSVDILAIKWDADGNQQWLRTLEGTAGNVDQAVAVAVDSQDNVIASGFTTNADTGQDFTVVWLCTNCP